MVVSPDGSAVTVAVRRCVRALVQTQRAPRKRVYAAGEFWYYEVIVTRTDGPLAVGLAHKTPPVGANEMRQLDFGYSSNGHVWGRGANAWAAPAFSVGDVIGCGFRQLHATHADGGGNASAVFFTRNGAVVSISPESVSPCPRRALGAHACGAAG